MSQITGESPLGSQQVKMKSGRRLRGGLSFAAAAVVVASIAAPLASASASAKSVRVANSKAPSVKAGKAYFVGKTITFIFGGAPGSTNYDAAQVLIPPLEAYLHCTVVLNDNPNGNSITAENLEYAQPANGLSIGYLGITGVLAADLSNQTTVNFALRNVDNDIIMGSPQGNYVLVATASSGIRSMSQLVNLTPKVNMLDTTSAGIGNVFERILVGLYPDLGLNILSAYSSSATELAGLVRGDGPIGLIPPPNLETYIPAGQMYPLMTENKPPVGSVLRAYLDKVPTFTGYARDHPVKGKSANETLKQAILWYTEPAYAFFVPPGTPESYQLALTAAFKHATSLESTKIAQLADGVAPGFVSPKQMLPIIRSEINNDTYIGNYLPK